MNFLFQLINLTHFSHLSDWSLYSHLSHLIHLSHLSHLSHFKWLKSLKSLESLYSMKSLKSIKLLNSLKSAKSLKSINSLKPLTLLKHCVSFDSVGRPDLPKAWKSKPFKIERILIHKTSPYSLFCPFAGGPRFWGAFCNSFAIWHWEVSSLSLSIQWPPHSDQSRAIEFSKAAALVYVTQFC